VSERQPSDQSAVPPAFAIQATPAQEDGVAVLVISGEADLATSGRFREHVERALDAKAKGLVADVAEVTFMDSTMLRELLRAHRELEAAGSRFVLAGVQPEVKRLLDLTGTIELFSLAPTRAAAVTQASAR
jgi:anti-anti-sigma factor